MIIADSYSAATILFVDIVGFTRRSANLSAEEVVTFLNRFFTMIDGLVEEHEVEKIKVKL